MFARPGHTSGPVQLIRSAGSGERSQVGFPLFQQPLWREPLPLTVRLTVWRESSPTTGTALHITATYQVWRAVECSVAHCWEMFEGWSRRALWVPATSLLWVGASDLPVRGGIDGPFDCRPNHLLEVLFWTSSAPGAQSFGACAHGEGSVRLAAQKGFRPPRGGHGRRRWEAQAAGQPDATD